MVWEVELSEQFEAELQHLSEAVNDEVFARLGLL